MLLHSQSRWAIFGASVIMIVAAYAAPAEAIDISITGARIEGGKLLVDGITDAPNTQVRLEGRTSAKYNTTSDANRMFSFEVVLHPAGCIVSLQKVTPPSTLGPKRLAVVADCARNSRTLLFAQVNADGTVANSTGGVTTIKIGTGLYEVDFGVDIASCASVMTQGEAGVGGAGGGITGVTDRAGNPEAVFATMRTYANVLVDRAFHLLVVCAE
jgi:hypothetical protein